MLKYIKLIMIGGTILFIVTGIGAIAIQFIPVDRTNPPVANEPVWNVPETRALMEKACFDCHSNETKWPWYTQVAPVSWYIARHVHEGRHKINYSEWNPNQENESVKVILKGKMPPRSYLLMHPEARLTKAETRQLISGLRATFGDSLDHK
jgi:hypothetical protein